MKDDLWFKFSERGESMESNLQEAKQLLLDTDKDFQLVIEALLRAHADLDNMILTAFQIKKEK